MVPLRTTKLHQRPRKDTIMQQVLTMPEVAGCGTGVITRWYKQPGDGVLRGESLVEITFSSVAQPIVRYKETTDQQDWMAHLVDPMITLIPIRTESHANIISTTTVACTIHMVVTAGIVGVLRAITDATGQPIRPGAIIAVIA